MSNGVPRGCHKLVSHAEQVPEDVGRNAAEAVSLLLIDLRWLSFILVGFRKRHAEGHKWEHRLPSLCCLSRSGSYASRARCPFISGQKHQRSAEYCPEIGSHAPKVLAPNFLEALPIVKRLARSVHVTDQYLDAISNQVAAQRNKLTHENSCLVIRTEESTRTPAEP